MIEQHREGAEAVRKYIDMLWEEEGIKENIQPKQDKRKGRAATIETEEEEEDETPIPIPPLVARSSTGIWLAFQPVTKKPRQYFTPP